METLRQLLTTIANLFGVVVGLVAGFISVVVKRDFTLQHNQLLANEIEERTKRAVAEIGTEDAKSTKVTLESGIKLHVVSAGPEDGELIVMLHGFPECWYTWQKHIGYLAKLGFHVVAPDMRGYNMSEKPHGLENYKMGVLVKDVADLIKYYQKQNAIIVSHDWGAGIAWRFAMDYPELVSKLIVMNGPHPVNFAKSLKTNWKQKLMSWYIMYFQIPFLPEFTFLSMPYQGVRNILKSPLNPSAFSAADYDYQVSAWCQPRAMTSMINYYRAFIRLRDKTWRPKVINAPTLLLWAENDSALSVDLTKGLSDKWVPNIDIRLVPNCSHWITHEAPEVVQKHVTQFLQQQ